MARHLHGQNHNTKTRKRSLEIVTKLKYAGRALPNYKCIYEETTSTEGSGYTLHN